ncbi:40S ribosomal protein S13 [Portunus trituberculatus]|uniref:40S ribosomal protein S13 n=1 Tax=Portunus trituberculatus TaxID=210409 RepID=A0A5B7EZU4_PORTR|nr:40S ribosomal protein S13 [Portunus trituberculatus]
MGRMHSGGKGISQSALPYRRSVPNWLKLTKDDVEDQIVKLAKKGLTPSQIGTVLTRCLHEQSVTKFSQSGTEGNRNAKSQMEQSRTAFTLALTLSTLTWVKISLNASGAEHEHQCECFH